MKDFSILKDAFSRRDFLRAGALAAGAFAAPGFTFASEPEKKSVTIAVGGKNLYYYLPMAFADWNGYFKEEGLDVKVVDFQGGFAVNNKTMKDFKSVADLRGKRIGVTAPGSSSHVIANFVFAKAGVKPNEFAVIGIGSGAGAVAAVRAGQVDAFVGLDPVISQLEGDGTIRIVTDTRNVEESNALFGGPMVAGCV